MKTFLDLTALSLIVANLLAGFLAVWLGVNPDLPLASFLKESKSIAAYAPLLTLPLAVIAFILGRDPKWGIFHFIRQKLVIPLFLTERRVTVLILLLLAIGGGQGWYFSRIFQNPFCIFFEYVRASDYEGAERFATRWVKPKEAEFLALVAAAFTKAEERLSRSENAGEAQRLASQLQNIPQNFGPLWKRYLTAVGLAKARFANGDFPQAIASAKSASVLARWLGPEQKAFSALVEANLYFLDKEKQLRPSRTEGLNEAISVLKQVSTLSVVESTAVLRLLGNCYYEKGDFPEAVKSWSDALAQKANLTANDQKMLKNNVALARGRSSFWDAAILSADEGIRLPFDKNDEGERREQVRLLATKTLMLMGANRYKEADETWKERAALMHAEPGKCSKLIDCQLFAHKVAGERRREARDPLRAQLVEKMADALSLPSAGLTGLEQRRQLLNQCSEQFTRCWSGLIFDEKILRTALEIPEPRPSQN